MSGVLSLVVALQLARTCAGGVAAGSQLFGVAYLVTNKVNGKRYVGVTKQQPGKRWAAHKSRAQFGATSPLARSIHKYGAESFTFEVVASASSYDDLYALEQLLIAQMGCFWVEGRGYNLTLGGDGQRGRHHTDATRAKMSATRAGGTFSQTHRAAMAAAYAEKKHSAESELTACKNRRTYRPGAVRSAAQIAARIKGTENLRKSATARSRPVITPAGRFRSLSHAAREHGVTVGTAKCRAVRRWLGWRLLSSFGRQPFLHPLL